MRCALLKSIIAVSAGLCHTVGIRADGTVTAAKFHESEYVKYSGECDVSGWSRFLSLMKHDRTKLLLPCYRDMDPYDMPEQLSILQSYDMAKIGFIQDLIRGVNKVLDADKKPEPVKETVVVQCNVFPV